MSPEKLFPSYPFESIKEAVLNKFVWIGRVCSVAIAVYSITSFLRSICTGIVDCIYLRRIGARVRDLCTFAISPNTYFLNTLPPRYENTYANIYPSEKPKLWQSESIKSLHNIAVSQICFTLIFVYMKIFVKE